MCVHELGIAQSICQAVAEHSGGARVTFMRVEVGALAGVLPDALDFCIREVARETGLGEPEVVIAEVQPLLRCACGMEYTAEEMLEPCPSCGGWQRQVINGMDITITELRIEEADDA